MSKNYCVFDIKCNGLLPKVTTIYCFSYNILSPELEIIERRTIFSKSDIVELFNKDFIFVGHNIIQYDLPVLKKLFGIDINSPENIIDTLSLSWYLYNQNQKHNLTYWKQHLGLKKDDSVDEECISLDICITYCQKNVTTTVKIFKHFMEYLYELYNNDFWKIIRYLSFKMMILHEHELNPLKVNIRLCEEEKHKLEYLYNVKISKIKEIMPKDLGAVLKTAPKKQYNQDGSKTILYEKWLEELRERNLPEDTAIIYKPPNPNSTAQIKQWLIRLGWIPDVYVKNSKGESIPQIYENGEIVESIQQLYTKEPYLKELNSLSIIKHRLGLLKAFLETVDKNGYICCSSVGLSSTLRYKHRRPLANLPTTNKPYSENIRRIIIVPDDSYLMCGCDINSLEDTTKQHYIYFFDKEYIEQLRVPDFDPHCDIGILAGLMTEEDAQFFKSVEKGNYTLTDEEVKRYSYIKDLRQKAKKVNFGCTYGAGVQNIAKTAGISLSEAQKLYNAYWERNKSLEKVSEAFQIKTLSNKTTWVLNPLSGFWVSLHSQKDVFAIVNQSSGVYVFDIWISFIKQLSKYYGKEIFINYEYHDEILIIFKNEDKDYIAKVLKEAIVKVNETIHTNVPFDITLSFGINYGDCH